MCWPLKATRKPCMKRSKAFWMRRWQSNKPPNCREPSCPERRRRSRSWKPSRRTHGRIETRRYYQSDVLDWFADKEKWEGLQSVGMVQSLRESEGKVSEEWRY